MATTAPPSSGPAPVPVPGVPVPRRRRSGPVRDFLEEAGELLVFAGQSLAAIPGTFRYISEALRQASLMLRGTLVLLFVMNAFLGMTLTNVAYFLLRTLGASDYLGVVSGYGTPRQIATTMFGYVFTAKVCCGMTAELGAMKIQQEIDAYESTAVDPRKYLVGARLVGVILFVPVAVVVGLIGSIAGSYFEAVVVIHGISSNVLLDVHWSVQTVNDQLFSLVTVFAIAIPTAIVACFYGLRTTGGPAAVGTSVARAIYVNLVILHLIAVFCAVVYYGTNINLPIGG
ncbi:MAG: hypothetical protein JWO02_1651 [Solirubrobacterales bacterium]|nr:hypothetical protein [Solirubrobacterales bacterium]